jgi:hypothetical protein
MPLWGSVKFTVGSEALQNSWICGGNGEAGLTSINFSH